MATFKKLTIEEAHEFEQLKKKLFKGESFVVFSNAERATPDFIRYEELLTRVQKFRRLGLNPVEEPGEKKNRKHYNFWLNLNRLPHERYLRAQELCRRFLGGWVRGVNFDGDVVRVNVVKV